MGAGVYLTAALLCDQPEFRAPERAEVLAVEIERAERRWHLPALLLAATVLIESGGKSVVSRRRRCGGWDVGVGQVHTHERERFRLLLTLSTNLDLSAGLLAGSIKRCDAHPRWAACRSCAAGLYNAGGHTRWCQRLLRVWRQLQEGLREGNV